MRLVRHIKHQGTKFISGTMPPAPSTATELEPLESALEYFRKRGVEKVVLQPKYMGSRCQLYLYRDVEKGALCGESRGLEDQESDNSCYSGRRRQRASQWRTPIPIWS